MSCFWSHKSISAHLLTIAKEGDSLITADTECQQISTPQSLRGVTVLVQGLQDATDVQTLQ